MNELNLLLDIIMDSQILTEEEKLKLRQMFIKNNYEMHPEWKLIYRGSDEGFDSHSWNEKCTEKQNLIAIIHSSSHNVFGGFSVNGWVKPSAMSYEISYKEDYHAFLYSLRSSDGNKEPEIFRIKPEDVRQATVSECNHMCCFGFNGYDMAISDKCNENRISWVAWQGNRCSFKTPTGNYLNGGRQNFSVLEIEVFMNCKK